MPANLSLVYKRLLEKYRKLVVLGSAEGIISWDMETMMPPKAVELRSEQLALLSEIHHKMITSPQIGRLLDVVIKNPKYDDLSDVEKRNVYLIKKGYEEQTKLPTKLVKAIAKQQAITVNNWKKAKAQKSFATFKPELEKLVALNMEAAEIFMKVKETKTPYDALIDIYEPKMTTQKITSIFAELEQGLKKLLSRIESKPQNSKIVEHVPAEKQREIAKLLIQTLGYETPPSPNAAGRLDETEHPFTTGYYDDVRITTHYHTDNFINSIFSVLHETGHALYEEGLPQQWKYMPVGSPCSMGIHESQSRLYENIIGRSQEFWSNLMPKMKKAASPSLSNLELSKFVHAINSVKPSRIRIEADEVTYSLHVIIRFQIEKDLFTGKIDVPELPQLWNEKYQEILGVKVEDDAEGVMQDTHWASGLYGYFPTYALGNIVTGLIVEAIQKENPTWRNELGKGNLEPVRKWLAANIYSRGNLYDPSDLVKKATATNLNVKPYLEYLEEKYRNLYGF